MIEILPPTYPTDVGLLRARLVDALDEINRRHAAKVQDAAEMLERQTNAPAKEHYGRRLDHARADWQRERAPFIAELATLERFATVTIKVDSATAARFMDPPAA